jgi:hypothetical protein
MAGEQPVKERRAGGAGPLIFLAAGAMALVLAFYVLSVGPVAWLVDNNFIDGNSPLLHLYLTPLGLLAACCPPLEWALEAYMELFQ